MRRREGRRAGGRAQGPLTAHAPGAAGRPSAPAGHGRSGQRGVAATSAAAAPPPPPAAQAPAPPPEPPLHPHTPRARALANACMRARRPHLDEALEALLGDGRLGAKAVVVARERVAHRIGVAAGMRAAGAAGAGWFGGGRRRCRQPASFGHARMGSYMHRPAHTWTRTRSAPRTSMVPTHGPAPVRGPPRKGVVAAVLGDPRVDAAAHLADALVAVRRVLVQGDRKRHQIKHLALWGPGGRGWRVARWV